MHIEALSDVKDERMRCIYLVAAVSVVFSQPAVAEFVGDLNFTPAGCEQSGQCRIASEFRYNDPHGVGWITKAGDVTDGASIPSWARPFVGGQFDKHFLNAAVIHDHYCRRQVRPWRQTHRVFYDALVESGLPAVKAKLMYFAVYLGGPKWVKVIPGIPCGKNCIYKYEGALIPLDENKIGVVARAADYTSTKFEADLAEAVTMMADSGDTMSLEDLERLAAAKMPGDFFYKNGDSFIGVGGPPLQ